MIDIGINFTDKAFEHDLEQSIQAAVEAGVTAMVVTGTSQSSSEHALQLTAKYADWLHCTAGVHPHHAKDWNKSSYAFFHDIAAQPKVVAIGETGLDFNRDFSPRPQQEAAFEQHLELAAELKKPLFLHERDAFERQHSILKHHRDHYTEGVIHCFTGDKKSLFAYLDLDLYIGITGWVCDERRGLGLQRLVKEIPANRLMIETDGPYLLPRDLPEKPKSRRNEPKYLPHIAAKIADLRNDPFEEFCKNTTANTVRFFNLNQTPNAAT